MSGPLGSSQWFKPSQFYSHSIDQSARFDSGSSAVLSRTPGTTGNRRTWTWSGWVKRSVLGTSQNFYTLFSAGPYTGSSTHFAFYYSGSKIDIISFYQYTGGYEIFYETNAVFTDPSAWYHFVVEVDITQATSTDRVKIYVNGTQITSFQTSTAPSSATLDTYLNWTGATHYVGSSSRASTDNLSGYLAEVNFIDGTALDADSFGETKAGIWVPKDTSGLTFGTNGYRLKFQDSSSIGDNTGGNTLSPAFTVGGLVADDVVLDSPTNNFCTLNPLFTNGGTVQSFSEGNLKFTGDSNYALANGTFAMRSGKWYWETLIQAQNVSNVGITKGTNANANAFVGYDPNGNVSGFGYQSTFIYGTSGDGITSGTASASGQTSYTTGDIIGCSFDADAGELKFYKNNSLVYTISSINEHDWFPANSAYGTSNVNVVNFGQDSSFANNKTSGSAAASDDNGVGDFYYTPPSGFLALCSANLPDPAIDPAENEESSDHFNTVLYTGTGSTRSVTGVGFQPDWVWIKQRSGTAYHNLYDSLRIVSSDHKRLYSNEKNSEESSTYLGTTNLTSFDSDGFSVGDGSDTNNNTSTYVAWNWLAGGTTPTTQTYKVVVDNDGANKYRFRNSADSATFATYAPTIELQEGGTYVFDWSDDGTNGVVSAQGHPIRFSTTSNGTHGGGTEYTTGVVKDDSAYTTTITVAAGAPTLYYYCQYHSGMGGQINTNSTHGSSNFDGSVQSTVSANTEAGFSIVSYTGTGATSQQTIGVGLSWSGKDKLVITKNRDDNTYNWGVNSNLLSANKLLSLNTSNNDAQENSAHYITYETFGFRTYNGTNILNLSNNYIAYCFHSVDGYSKVGTYVGNNATTFVYTGFKPAFLLIKSIDEGTGADWGMFDNTRPDGTGGTSGVKFLQADISNSEGNSATVSCFFLSNGFEIGTSNVMSNASGDNFVYLAFSEQPFKYSNAE